MASVAVLGTVAAVACGAGTECMSECEVCCHVDPVCTVRECVAVIGCEYGSYTVDICHGVSSAWCGWRMSECMGVSVLKVSVDGSWPCSHCDGAEAAFGVVSDGDLVSARSLSGESMLPESAPVAAGGMVEECACGCPDGWTECAEGL